MKTIYILLTQSGTILSRLVHLVTAENYTHVSLAFDRDLQLLYSSSRKNGSTLFPAGPCHEQLGGGYYRAHPDTPCVLYELQVEDASYALALEKVQHIMAHQDRYHFNVWGLIFCQLRIPFRRKYHYFCSQFVSEILSESAALRLPKEPSLMKPGDYTRLPGLVCRFQGRLCELRRGRAAVPAV